MTSRKTYLGDEVPYLIDEQVAGIAHEANRAYCRALGDTSPGDSHANWLRYKLGEGWRHGPVKDLAAKTHPCLLPWNELPAQERMKDVLFLAIVRRFM